MPDLEDVLTNLNKFKTKMEECIKFIDKLEELFGSIDAAHDIGGESIGNGGLPDLIEYINDHLIYNKYNTCLRCHGRGEIMTREFAIDSDGSQDIGTTPHPILCPRCNGEGKIERGKNQK